LSRLNRSVDQPVAVSDMLWEVFHAARQTEQDTDGLVRPTVLDALIQAGYDRSFELLPQLGQPTALGLLELPTMTTAIVRDESARTLCLPEGVHLDFGGVAKGWAADKAADRLKHYGSALVDAGGDIAVSGPRLENQPWPIGVRDPFQPESYFETLFVRRGGVATSGIDFRRWQQGGLWQHHIIDPRTGLPAQTDVLSATVIAPSAFEAEVAAKVILLYGSVAGVEWLEEQENYAAVIVREDGRAVYSAQLSNYLWN